jgi:hypothetical protein
MPELLPVGSQYNLWQHLCSVTGAQFVRIILGRLNISTAVLGKTDCLLSFQCILTI